MGLSQQLNSLFVKPRLQFLAQDGDGRPAQLETALASNRRLIVQGEPGSGKTTLLQWLAVRAAQTELSGEETAADPARPFFLRLRDWSQAGQEAVPRLADLVAMPLGLTVPPQSLRQRLAEGSALLLIDGLDELPSRARGDAWARSGS